MENEAIELDEIDISRKEEIYQYLIREMELGDEGEARTRDVAEVIACLPSNERREAMKSLTDNNVLSNPRLAAFFILNYGMLTYAKNSGEQIAKVERYFLKSLSDVAKRVVDEFDGKMQTTRRENVEGFEEAVQVSIGHIYQAILDLKAHQKDSLDIELRINSKLESLEEKTDALVVELQNAPGKVIAEESARFKNILYAENSKALKRIKDDVVAYVKSSIDEQRKAERADRNFKNNLYMFIFGFGGTSLALVLSKFLF